MELEAVRNLSKSITNFEVWSPIPLQEITYNNISLPFCGKSTFSPTPPTGEPATIPGNNYGVLADISAKRARRSDSPGVPPVNPNVPCPSGKLDPSKGICIPDTDKLPRLYINEIFPCQAGDPTRHEYVELRLYPFSMILQMVSYRLVAFTAYTNKLLLVINIYNKHTINQGFILFKNPSDASIQVPKDRSNYGNFQILPCSTQEPIVLLLLRQPTHPVLGWHDIKLVGARNTSPGFSPRLIKTKPGSSQANLLNVFKETVIDGIVYGIPISSAVSQDIKDLVNVGKNNCNFVLPVSNSDIENTITLSLNACPVVDPIYFDAEHFKLGRQTPGSRNDCNSRNRFQLEEIEQSRSLENEVGVTRQSKSALDCPAEKETVRPQIAEIDALINYEIQFIRQKLDPSYESEFYPVKKFKTAIWPKLLKTQFNTNHPDFPKDIFPFEKISISDTSNIPQITDNLRCGVCHKRLLTCPHSFKSQSLVDKLISSNGHPIPTQTKALQRHLMEHVNRRTHYTSVLYLIREDRRRLAADARMKHRTPEEDGLRLLANAFLVSYTLVKTNTAFTGATTWYKTLKKIEANVGTGVILQGKQAAKNMIMFISNEGFSNIKNYLVRKSYPFTILLGKQIILSL